MENSVISINKMENLNKNILPRTSSPPIFDIPVNRQNWNLGTGMKRYYSKPMLQIIIPYHPISSQGLPPFHPEEVSPPANHGMDGLRLIFCICGGTHLWELQWWMHASIYELLINTIQCNNDIISTTQCEIILHNMTSIWFCFAWSGVF